MSNKRKKVVHTKSTNGEEVPKPKRKICNKCKRPTPAACICPSLPSQPLPPFKKCRVIVLQHPHENRRKNRSLPLIELCLGDENEFQNNSIHEERTFLHEDVNAKNDFNLRTVIGRRLGERTPVDIMSLIQKPNVLLIYPSEDSLTLSEGIELIQKRKKTRKEIIISENHTQSGEEKEKNSTNKNGSIPLETENGKCQTEEFDEKITVVFIDATWKYAKEMERKNTMMNLWPKDLIRVKLCPSKSMAIAHRPPSHNSKSTSDNDNQLEQTISQTQDEQLTHENTDMKIKTPSGYKPHRFDIRTPPSANHLSTAECIAWVVSVIEQDGSIYDTLMKPLDYMVKLWHSFDSNRGKSWADVTNESIGKNCEQQDKNMDQNNIGGRRTRPKLFSD